MSGTRCIRNQWELSTGIHTLPFPLELLELWGTERYRIQVGPIPLISQDCQFRSHHKKRNYIIFVIKNIYRMQMRKCGFRKVTR